MGKAARRRIKTRKRRAQREAQKKRKVWRRWQPTNSFFCNAYNCTTPKKEGSYYCDAHIAAGYKPAVLVDRPHTPKKVEKWGKELNERLPEAERWFRRKWNQRFPNPWKKPYAPRYNYAWGNYIPDVISIGYQYIIEIDEPHHELPENKARDIIRDRWFEDQGFTVIRVKAYDDASFEAAVKRVQALRVEKSAASGCDIGQQPGAKPLVKES